MCVCVCVCDCEYFIHTHILFYQRYIATSAPLDGTFELRSLEEALPQGNVSRH